ncbi:MAG: sulfotransferase [Phycisphaeraceae bacterium]
MSALRPLQVLLPRGLTDPIRRYWHCRLSHGLFVDLGRDLSRTLVVAGSGRSGTTWLAELINFRRTHRFIFEPLNREQVPLVRHFHPVQYLRPQTTDARFVDPVNRLLLGRIRNSWTDQFTNPRPFYSRRLVKMIRGNLLLKWLHTQFPQVPIILILRHPCASALSHAKLGWKIDVFSEFLAQEELVCDFLGPYVDMFRQARDPIEGGVVRWCIENVVPLRQFGPGQVHLMCYEELCQNPEVELRRLARFLGRPFNPAVLRKINRPSALSRSHSAITTGTDLTDGWRRELEPRQNQQAVKTLARFGLDTIYNDSPMPDSDAAQEMLRANVTSFPVRD